MKKRILFGLVAFSSIALIACGNDERRTTEQIEASVDSQANEATVSLETDDLEEVATSAQVDYHQEIIDDDVIKVTLMSIDHVVDNFYDEEKYIISFDVTNKREDAIEVQARSVSINDRMVDEALLSMSTSIAGGKSATASLEIRDYSGGDLPEMTGNLELNLKTFDWDDYDYDYEVPVLVAIK